MVTVRRGTSLAAAAVRAIGLVIVAIIVIHVILVLLGANPANAFATFIGNLTGWLSLGLTNLFAVADAKINVLVNYGIAALVWLLITGVVVAVVRRIG